MAGNDVADGIVWMNRTEVGLPATVFSTDGHTHRPKLAVPCRWITLHYTGAPTPRSTSTRADVVAQMQALEANAINAGKSNEYNYVIFGIDEGAVIVEYAGAFRAAHSEGENDQSVGVMFNLGCTKVDAAGKGLEFQSMPDSMVNAYRYLRDEVLRKFAITNLNTLEVLHQEMPDASTQCPGDSVIGRRAELLGGGGFVQPFVRPLVDLGGGFGRDTLIDPLVFGGLQVVEPGSKGDAVKRLQALLLVAGFDPGSLDGKYSKKATSPTRAAVVGFQTARQLSATGRVGLTDWAHLLGVR